MIRNALVNSLVLSAMLAFAAAGAVRADDVRDLDHIVFAGLNTAGQDGVVESSITFLANANMDQIMKHLFDKDVLSKIAPDNLKVLDIKKTSDTSDSVEYSVQEEIKPMGSIPMITEKLVPTKVNVHFTVSKRALAERTIFVKYELENGAANGWEVLSGRVYAVDLKNGHSMVMLASSTKSKYGMANTIRLKLAKLYLEKTKTHILNWLTEISK